MNTRQAEPTNALALIIEPIKGEIEALSRTSGVPMARFVNAARTAIELEPKLRQCTQDSLRRAILACVRDGLIPDSREAVILPYFDKDPNSGADKKVMMANYQPMVAGVIKRLRELGGVFSITCELVHEKDSFEVNRANPEETNHTFSGFGERGEIVGCYAIFRDPEGRVMHREIMDRAALEKVRRSSKVPDSPAYKNFEGEMYRKITIRRGAKFISINNERLMELFSAIDTLFDFSAKPEPQRVDPFTGVIEGEVVDGEPAEKGNGQSQEAEKKESPKDRLAKVRVNDADKDMVAAALGEIFRHAASDVDSATGSELIRQATEAARAGLKEYLRPWVDHSTRVALRTHADKVDNVDGWRDRLIDELAWMAKTIGVAFQIDGPA